MIRSWELNLLPRFMKRMKASLDIAMIPAAMRVMCFVMMPKNCLWTMLPAVLTREKLRISLLQVNQ